jgi:hypothetical protein
MGMVPVTMIQLEWLVATGYGRSYSETVSGGVGAFSVSKVHKSHVSFESQ